MKKTILTLVLFWLATLVHAGTLPGPLVDAEWLAANRDKVVVLDVRIDPRTLTRAPVFRKDRKTGKKVLVQVNGHIPGALWINYKKIRGTRIVDGRKVEKMILDKAAFEKVMQSAGVPGGKPLVIVSQGLSNGDMTMATRLYWQLKYYGSDDMAILDGGLAGWILAGKPVATDPPGKGGGDWVATAERREILATSADVERAMKDGKAQLVDNRPLDQYLGTWHKSYVYAAGHIPGARIFANSLMTRPAKPARFLPVGDLKALAEGLGLSPDRPTITYCNSGHLASGGWFIWHELFGNKDTKLYDGSMHEWTLEKRPVRKFVLEK